MSLTYYLAADGVTPITVTEAKPLPVSGGGGGSGGGGTVDNPSVVAGVNGTGPATVNNPLPVHQVQGNLIWGDITLEPSVASTIIGAFADRRGIVVLNYTQAGVYIAPGMTGTPPLGGGSEYIPPIGIDGAPGRWEPKFAPVGGLRAVGPAGGKLTVIVW